jgi:membrane-bound lytic murein transglycosylase B
MVVAVSGRRRTLAQSRQPAAGGLMTVSRRAAGATLLAWLTAGAPALAAPDKARKRRASRAQASRNSKPETAAGSAPYAGREDVLRFATEVADRREWSRRWVQKQLEGARMLPAVQKLMMPAPAGTQKNWAAYRDRFVEPVRIAAGVAFWQANERWLTMAEERFGVPAHIVVGIVGVETFYGRIRGGFRVLDALATLAFDFPRGRRDRTPFFRDELEELLALAQRDGNIDLATLRGSYAGAFGLPQFMPSSFNRDAIDFDGDGHIDLIDNGADVVGSVANYLANHGWQRGMPTHYPVAVPADDEGLAALLGPDILPTFDAADFALSGAELSASARFHEGPMALVELRNGDAPPSFFAGTQNFYAVTRYNWSSYYAMAVIELGEAVAGSLRLR